jgi:endoglucanase
MRRRDFLVYMTAGALESSANGNQFAYKEFSSWQGGVNLAGAEFGTDNIAFSAGKPGVHGKDYVYNSKDTVHYFCRNNLRLIRCPFRWERLQPRLGQELNFQEASRLSSFVTTVADAGGRVVLDLHNYGRYMDMIDGARFERALHLETESREHLPIRFFCDVWRRIARAFAGHPGVAGYGLMNEPHDLPAGTWKVASQEAVFAIRSVDRRTPILVSGDSWAHAHRFEAINGPNDWVDDPADNLVYEAHCYFDSDVSGKYVKTFDEEVQIDPRMKGRGVSRITPFLVWCRRNGVRGLLGEVGVPSGQRWLDLLQDCIDTCREADVPLCGWAAGDWWGNYRLSLQPDNGTMKARAAIIGE